MIVTGKVLGIYVTASDSVYRQGIKGRQSGRSFSGGTVHIRNGYGGCRDITPKRITLVVAVGNQVTEVWIDRDFRFAIGNLSPKRTQAIIDSVPDVVSLYENENRQGQEFYCLTETSFTEWLKNSGL